MHKDLLKAFQKTVVDENGCWVWMGAKARGGYGLKAVNGKSRILHRAAYKILVGRIPDNKVLHHKCHNPACWNPSHLEVCSQRENLMSDPTLAAANAEKAFCPLGHPYTEDNTYLFRGSRSCLTCKKQRRLEQTIADRERRVSEGRFGRPTKTTCKNGHERTPENLTANLSCKICARIRAKAHYEGRR